MVRKSKKHLLYGVGSGYGKARWVVLYLHIPYGDDDLHTVSAADIWKLWVLYHIDDDG